MQSHSFTEILGGGGGYGGRLAAGLIVRRTWISDDFKHIKAI